MPIGRPTVMTPEVLKQLDTAFALGCSDEEACLLANISPQTLYNHQKENPGFLEHKEQLKKTPVLEARMIIVEGMKKNPKLALKFLERKAKAEFAPRTELSGPEGVPLGYIHSGDLQEPKKLEDGK